MTNPDRSELVKLADRLAFLSNVGFGYDIIDTDRSILRKSATALRRLASSDGGVKVRELEWEDADEGMCTKWRACALGGHYELVALDGDGGGLAVNFYWGRPLSFWFIQGEPDEWGPTGPKMFPTLDEAKSAAQADYEQRIMAAIETAPQPDNQPSLSRKLVSETGKELPKNTEQPMNNADVSVGELAGFFVTEFPHLLTMSTQIEVARALLARYRIERLDRLTSSGRR